MFGYFIFTSNFAYPLDAGAAVVVVGDGVGFAGQFNMLGQTPQAALHVAELTFMAQASGHKNPSPNPGKQAVAMATLMATKIRVERNFMVDSRTLCWRNWL